MSDHDPDPPAQRWARFRFGIVARLLASPPKRGTLHRELESLARRTWTHPTSGVPVTFGVSTLERWYYRARNEARDPIAALRRAHRKDAGTRALNERLRQALHAQYKEHPGWSYQLHYDNLLARAARDGTLGAVPSYATVRRFMKGNGWLKYRPRPRRQTPGGQRAARRLERREVRSFEASHVHGLWHLDFHAGSRRVLTPAGQWRTPHLFGTLDDRSRLCCHLQWYLDETAETLVHGLSQAIQKRALPRALMSDNGAAMVAAETVKGLEELGILHQTTLAESPYQNGKQEAFWSQVEGRLLAMLEGIKELTLELLNEATQAWVELEYNKKPHQELGVAPLCRYLDGPDVGRPSPNSDALRDAFRLVQWRTQRRSDGTLSIEGRRFEVPSRFRHHQRLLVRFARFDLTHVDIVDPHSGQRLAPLYPLDKQRNADARRRRLAPLPETPEPAVAGTSGRMAPLLEQLISEYAASGLPPAYLPKHNATDEETEA
jgi:transposase InsO family protein